MARESYLALLRGINVGGRNKLAMADLRASFEAEGHADVVTYIQSGNVVFTTDADSPPAGLEADIETMVAGLLGQRVPVVVRSLAELGQVVDKAPPGFGEQPQTYRYDVIFLKAPLTAVAALAAIRPRDGVDQVWSGPGVVYFSRLDARRSQSRMSRIAGTPEYANMTIRNWNTTTKLMALLGG